MAEVVTSFVLAAFNATHTLAPTIDSILGQTDRDFELIVINDGSTDGTAALLAQYAARDSRVLVIEQENTGLTRALVRGCAAASGRYIARHDAGDRSYPERLAMQRALLDRDSTVAFVSCWTEFVGPEDEPLFVTRGPEAATQPVAIIDLNREHGIIGGPTHHGSVVFRRHSYERAGRYRAEFYFGQDWDLWYRLAAIGRFQIVPRVLYTARIDGDSISTSARGAQAQLARLSHAALVARTSGVSETHILEEAAQVRRPNRHWPCAQSEGFYFIGEALRQNGDARARAYFRRAILACPLHLKAWIRLVQTWFS